MLSNSVAVAVVVRTRPRTIPLAMITMRKSTHGFPFLSYMSMGLHLAALPAAGALLLPACQILRDFCEGLTQENSLHVSCVFCVSVMVIIKISKSTDVFLRARADYLSFRPQREYDCNTPFTPTKLVH